MVMHHYVFHNNSQNNTLSTSVFGQSFIPPNLQTLLDKDQNPWDQIEHVDEMLAFWKTSDFHPTAEMSL